MNDAELTDINIQKALNLFNAALVTPTYYVFFTSSTIVTSAVLFRGFKGSPTSIVTVVLGFLQICAGVILLQLSKSAKDVPDAAVFKGDLDQVRTVAEQEEPESEPKADAIRGTAAIIRRFSQSRQKTELAEARRIHEERLKDQMEPIGEDEQVEWDGLRRRKTTISREPGSGNLQRRKTLHPPLGMTHFPDEEESESRPTSSDAFGSGGGFNGGFMNSFKKRAQSKLSSRQGKNLSTGTPEPLQPMDLAEITVPPGKGIDTSYQSQTLRQQFDGSMEMEHVYGLPGGLSRRGGDEAVDDVTSPIESHSKPIMWADAVETRPSASRGSSLAPTPPPHAAKRQFSFQNVFNRHKQDPVPSASADLVHQPHRPSSRLGIGSRQSSHSKKDSIPGIKSATEEERLGLVKGDSQHMLSLPDYTEQSDEDDWQLEGKPTASAATSQVPLIREEKEIESASGSPTLRPADRNALGMEEDEPRRYKEWEGQPGGGGGGGSRGSGPAFI